MNDDKYIDGLEKVPVLGPEPAPEVEVPETLKSPTAAIKEALKERDFDIGGALLGTLSIVLAGVAELSASSAELTAALRALGLPDHTITGILGALSIISLVGAAVTRKK